MKKPKLFIPGPTHVNDTVLEAMASYPIGHRASSFSALYDEIVAGVQKVLFTKNRIFLGTCSATGLMEAAVKNTVRKRCANFVCGAFSERWHKITKSSGIECDKIEVPLGHATTPDLVRKVLDAGKYDTVTVVHNETSTGVMNPIYEIAEVMNEYPDIVFLVDMVSSMASIKVEIDKLGIDVAIASVQKGWALPPGFSVCSVSKKVMERSKELKYKGYYFDFLVMEKYAQKSQTHSTPSIPHMFGLKTQLGRIFFEGLNNRFNRHKELANMVRTWGENHFSLFAQERYRSDTVTCINNLPGFSLAEMITRLFDKGFHISGGYGPLKDKTFRIAHMGDIQKSDIEELLFVMNETIKEMNL
ncbi:MAG: alanine--glyoxylate aminotransferase family protein [Candidatus Marinimicrobia bacterium]|nr:alanine--glyoxylate aminotransferase family protein [Candidatus Neomarinimicrobiota bacterium]